MMDGCRRPCVRHAGSRRSFPPARCMHGSNTKIEKDRHMNRNDIIKRKFSHAFFGYDVEDVDLFLDEIIREMDRVHNELDIETLKAEAARQREEKLRARMSVMERLLAEAGIELNEELFIDRSAEDEPTDEAERIEEPCERPEFEDAPVPPADEPDEAEEAESEAQ